MTERIRPVLMVNKIDRQILELKTDAESMYQNFIRVIDMVNVIVSTYEVEDMGDLLLLPNKGNVAFGSGKEQWGFTLTRFAKMYKSKLGMDESKLMEKFWGDNYYDAKAKKWNKTGKTADGKPLERGFCAYIMKPVLMMARSIMEADYDQMDKLLKVAGVKLTPEDRMKEGK